MPDYVAYLFVPSAVRLPADQQIAVQSSPGERPQRSVRVRTEYLPPPHEAGPKGLRVEVRGEVESLERTVDPFLALGGELLPTMALAANAFIDDPRLIVAYDVTPGVKHREWIQRFPDPEAIVPPRSREIAADDLGPLIEALEHHPKRDRVGRAIAHYREALRHLRPGDELMAVEHLQVAAETVTPVLVEHVCAEHGTTLDALAAEWGYDARRGTASSFVHSRVRLMEVYGGDNELRRRVERASTGFEHGYEQFDRARRWASESRDDAFRVVRHALLRASSLGSANAAALIDRYTVPLPLFSNEHLWRGTLEVDDEGMLAPGSQPVLLRDWKMKLLEARRSEDGETLMKADHDVGNPTEGARISLRKKITIVPAGLAPGGKPPRVTVEMKEAPPDHL